MAPATDIVFVCLHGSAKSLIAAELARLAAERQGLGLRFASMGTEPDPDVPAHVVAGLKTDGVDVLGRVPEMASAAAMAGARCVVTFGPDVRAMAPQGARIEDWKDVPDVSGGYDRARTEIRKRVEGLLGAFVP
jgi:protein-tyrosine-phosphatase